MDEEYLDTQPIATQVLGGAHSTEGSLRYQIETSNILEELEHGLKAEVPILDQNTNTISWQKPKGVEPLINQRGVNNVITLLRIRLTKIFVLSELEQESIEWMTINLGQTLIDDLYFNWAEYGIKDTAAASMIVALVCDTVFATLRKGYKGNYQKFISRTQSVQEVSHQSLRSAPQNSDNRESNVSMFKKLFGRR